MPSNGVRLLVAYDGTDFAGFQLQPNYRTVQGALEEALRRVSGEPTRIRFAGRTDAGVHALGQVVAFDTDRDLRMRNWVLALNSNLPHDIAVRAADPCEPGYDPRHDAVEKRYLYLLHLGVVRDPLLRNRVWHLGKLVRRDFPDRRSLSGATNRLDIEVMRRTAQLLVGTHDFRAFRATDDKHKTTIRTIHAATLLENHCNSPDLLGIEISGTAFLKNMVRIVTGTLVEVGRGRMTIEQFAALLQPGAKRVQAGETAPARGLTLLSVELGRKHHSG
ncbi:MAG: tRNA pseudouridine(38-40) synthase TruA [Deltaproteobacteria bacterium]|nr:tRNA pseudouridine(38-40) synthase TruA [Deltaproteobacteria bacterium]